MALQNLTTILSTTIQEESIEFDESRSILFKRLQRRHMSDPFLACRGRENDDGSQSGSSRNHLNLLRIRIRLERFSGERRRKTFAKNKKLFENQFQDVSHNYLQVQLDRAKEHERKSCFGESRKRLQSFFERKKSQDGSYMGMDQVNSALDSESLTKLDAEVNRRIFLKYRLKVERFSGARRRKLFERTRQIMAKKLSNILDPKQGSSGQSIASLSSKERSGILKRNKSYKESRKMFQDSKGADLCKRATGRLRARRHRTRPKGIKKSEVM